MDDKQFEEIKARNAARTQGAWYWDGHMKSYSVRLVSKQFRMPIDMYSLVMDFTRWGLRDAKPRFGIGGILQSFTEFVTPAKNAAFDTINHPDAEFIAKASEDVPTLIAEVERLQEALTWTQEAFGNAEKAQQELAKEVGRLQQERDTAWNEARRLLKRVGQYEDRQTLVEFEARQDEALEQMGQKLYRD